MVGEDCEIITIQTDSVQYSSPQDLLLYYGELFTVFKGASMSEILRKRGIGRN